MTKGRGANERRRDRRQKLAVKVGRLDPKDPEAIRYDAVRVERMWGNRNPDKRKVANHTPHTWALRPHPRTVKAAKAAKAAKAKKKKRTRTEGEM